MPLDLCRLRVMRTFVYNLDNIFEQNITANIFLGFEGNNPNSSHRSGQSYVASMYCRSSIDQIWQHYCELLCNFHINAHLT